MKKYVISVTTENSFLNTQKNADKLDEAVDYAKELVAQSLLGDLCSEDSVINISITKQLIY